MKFITININYLTIAIGIVFVWRGVWGLADLYLAPNNQALSFTLSIFIGVTILLVRDIKKKDLSELE